jgi:hypothetical protein
LGYGGTKTEMERLIKDAAKLDKSVKANDLSFGNIVKAINVVQTEMGITGTTAKEAGATISGSVGAMKAAWQNLLTGLANGNADIEQLVDNLVVTIVGDGTESNLGVFGNIMPAVETALNGAGKLVQNLVPKIMNNVPSILKKNLPTLVKAAVSTVKSLIKSIEENKDMLVDMVFDLFRYLVETFVTMLPQIIELGLSFVVSLANGIAENLPKLLPTITSVVLKIAEILTNKETLSQLFDAAITIIMTLADYLIDNVDKIFDAAVGIIVALADFLIDPENIMKITLAGIKVMEALGEGILSAVNGLSDVLTEITVIIIEKFSGIDLSDAGKKVIKSFFSGMLTGISGASSKYLFESFGGAIVGNIGITPNGSHRTGLDYVPYDGYIAELHKGERVLTAKEASSYKSPVIINQNIYSQPKSAADLMAEALYQQQKAVLLGG